MKTVYYNADVVTMDEACPSAEAVVVEDGKIVYVGTDKEALEYGREAECVNLNGKALLPGFIDPHSHFSGVAFAFLQVPLGESASFADIETKIRSHIQNNHVAKGSWISCTGYDHNALQEKAHPTAQWLDTFTEGYPVVLQHRSGHMGVFNSEALKALGITPDTECENGGRIGLTEDGKCSGYLEETIYVDTIKRTPMPSPQEIFGGFVRAQNKYASYGITTIQEGMFISKMAPMYEALLKNDMLQLDVIGYVDYKDKEVLLERFADNVRQYRNHFKVGGVKMILDGSPQGRTAWMLTPYTGTPDYCGYPQMEDAEVTENLKYAAKRGLQTLAHCNGDAAAAQYIRCTKMATKEVPELADLRTVMIHAQLCQPEQMPELAANHILPSFFSAHVYHWGDVHIENFGQERAAKISAVHSAIDQGVTHYTFHQDSPIIEPDMLETLWCVTNRITKNGTVLGEEECIPVYDALKGITINAAYQYFEEETKGSITPGKLADLVVLDRNPLCMDKTDLRDVQVLETIKEGKVVYKI